MASLTRSVLVSSVAPMRNASRRQLRRLRGWPREWRKDKAGVEAAAAAVEVEPLSFEGGPLPEATASGWLPAAEDGRADALPFAVERTTSRMLPVYTDYRNAGTRSFTVLRKASGDMDLLAKEMSKVCGGADVDVRPGRLEVRGKHGRQVTKWLVSLGF